MVNAVEMEREMEYGSENVEFVADPCESCLESDAEKGEESLRLPDDKENPEAEPKAGIDVINGGN